jgi:hypothetical protein
MSKIFLQICVYDGENGRRNLALCKCPGKFKFKF